MLIYVKNMDNAGSRSRLMTTEGRDAYDANHSSISSRGRKMAFKKLCEGSKVFLFSWFLRKVEIFEKI